METLIQGVIGMVRTRTHCDDADWWTINVFRNKKEYEPTLLVPMGLGTILVNFLIPAY